MAAVSRDNATLIAWLTGRPTCPPFPCVAVRGGADRASRDAFERRALDRMRARCLSLTALGSGAVVARVRHGQSWWWMMSYV